MNRVVASEWLWERVRAHLMSSDTERFAFLHCGVRRHSTGTSFLARDITLVSDEQVEFDNGFRVNVKALVDVTNRARKQGLALVEIHAHPFSGRRVSFSATDTAGFAEFVPYILDDLPGRPYGALVISEHSVDGLCWNRSPNKPETVSELVVVGRNLHRLSTTSASSRTNRDGESRSWLRRRTTRQVLALGQDAQAGIERTRIAIVGLGGLGSHIAQQLVYLGVRNFVLIDGDRVDPTSLNRMVLAGAQDIGRLKVEVIHERIAKLAGAKNVWLKAIPSDLRELNALEALKDVDVIFGCVDNDGARLVLNELASAYLIPYIDLAVGLTGNNGQISEAGGRVAVLLPGGPCLLCSKEVDLRQASDDLASKEELARRRAQGYAGPDLPSPSVVSLNGVVASIGAQEFLAFVSGIRPVRTFTVYDMMEPERSPVVSRVVSPDPDCLACAGKATGDKTWIERYTDVSGLKS